MSANSENDGPVSSFQSYAAEGDILSKQGDFVKAIDAYSTALILRPDEKNVLVARSKCHLKLGDCDSALSDAEASLKIEPDFFKGVFQKAEALYSKGDFELALVFYHRGNASRPEFDDFRLGIQKAREAIDNSIGSLYSNIDPRNYKFQPPAGARLAATGNVEKVNSKMGWITPKLTGQISSTQIKEKSIKVTKKLLGELYADKEYLSLLNTDKDFSKNPNNEIKSLVSDALTYLDTRTEFWRQQSPIYSRKSNNVSQRIDKQHCAKNEPDKRPVTAPATIDKPTL